MKERVLDILICPYDKTWPLKLHVFADKEISSSKIPKPEELTGVVCNFYCSKKGIKLVDENDDGIKVREEAKTVEYTKDCKECLSREIIAGMLECPECHSFYPIIEEIPMLLKAELRNENIERQFTEQWTDEIRKILPK